jgi:hypothetical protein
MTEVPAELLRDFTAWAERKNRSVDLMMLDEILRLRASYDELEPSYWPAGSVEHLLIERLPRKGPAEVYDAEVIVETLDAFFRFLRSTGRMSARSADPKELAKEARRNARLMTELASDRIHWSPNKVLADFGRSIGIELEGAPDLETLQERLNRINEAWNALPVTERRRLMPHAEDVGNDDLSEREIAMRHFDTDDPVQALVMTFATRLPGGELPTPEQVGPQFERSDLVRRLLALAEWVGDGRAVTSTGVLRPALAKQAYADLGLEEWTYARLHREYPDESLPGVAKVGRETWIEQLAQRPWSRAADCEALHRLWLAAAACGLIRVGSSKAVATGEVPGDPEGWVSLGLHACVELLEDLLDVPYRAVPILFALLTSYVDERRLVTWDELVARQQEWWHSPSGRRELTDELDWWTASERGQVRGSLARIADTGIVVESDEGIRLTDAGDVFVAAWLDYLEDSPGQCPSPRRSFVTVRSAGRQGGD